MIFKSLFRFSISSFQSQLKSLAHHFNQSSYLDQMVPRSFPQGLHDSFTLTAALSDPIYDLLDRGGKRLRPGLCYMIAQIFSKPYEDVDSIAALVELVHHGTLIVDDIEDSSDFRRGKPCVHKNHGVDIAINAGNFLYFYPLQQLMNSNSLSDEQKLKICIAYTNDMVSLHLGQASDIAWHNQKTIPTEEQYLQMAADKTGVLTRMSIKLSCIKLNVNEELTQKLAKFGEQLGVAFQIQDDILNLVGEEYKTKGQLGEDIHEGKLTLIVIHCLKNSRRGDRLLEILSMKTNDSLLIKEAIDIMKESRSIEYCQERCEKLIKDSWSDIEGLLEENEGKQNLKQMGEFVIGRQM